MDRLLGQEIGGKYRILQALGEGGMGQVYLAEQRGLRRRVALKVLRDGFLAEPRIVARFEREAAAAARISHPNSVTIFDFGRDETGLLFLVMELLEGESLSQRIKRQRRLSPGAATDVVMQLLGPLSACHAAGVIHRDVKPDNIFLCGQGGREQVKLLDYGVARVADGPEVTKSGQIVGTPTYMAPEQISGQPITPATDLYATGVILFEMLTGRPPFVERSHIELFRQHMVGEVPRLQELFPRRPDLEPYDRLLQRVLAKRAEDRYRSADAFRVALEEALREQARLGTPDLLEETVSDSTLAVAHADTMDSGVDMTTKMPQLHLATLELQDTTAIPAIQDPGAVSDTQAQPMLVLSDVAATQAQAAIPDPFSSAETKGYQVVASEVQAAVSEALTPTVPESLVGPPGVVEARPGRARTSATLELRPAEGAGQTGARWRYAAALVLATAALVVLVWPRGAAREAGVWLRSSPSGARITLDGVELGRTPVRVPLRVERGVFSVTREGCEPVRRELLLTTETAQIVFALVGDSCREEER